MVSAVRMKCAGSAVWTYIPLVKWWRFLLTVYDGRKYFYLVSIFVSVITVSSGSSNVGGCFFFISVSSLMLKHLLHVFLHKTFWKACHNPWNMPHLSSQSFCDNSDWHCLLPPLSSAWGWKRDSLCNRAKDTSFKWVCVCCEWRCIGYAL